MLPRKAKFRVPTGNLHRLSLNCYKSCTGDWLPGRSLAKQTCSFIAFLCFADEPWILQKLARLANVEGVCTVCCSFKHAWIHDRADVPVCSHLSAVDCKQSASTQLSCLCFEILCVKYVSRILSNNHKSQPNQQSTTVISVVVLRRPSHHRTCRVLETFNAVSVTQAIQTWLPERFTSQTE